MITRHDVAGSIITLSDTGTDALRTHFAYGIQLPYVPGSALPSESGRLFIGDAFSVYTRENAQDTHREALATVLTWLDASAGGGRLTPTDAYTSTPPNGFPGDVEQWTKDSRVSLADALFEAERVDDYATCDECDMLTPILTQAQMSDAHATDHGDHHPVWREDDNGIVLHRVTFTAPYDPATYEVMAPGGATGQGARDACALAYWRATYRKVDPSIFSLRDA